MLQKFITERTRSVVLRPADAAEIHYGTNAVVPFLVGGGVRVEMAGIFLEGSAGDSIAASVDAVPNAQFSGPTNFAGWRSIRGGGGR
jgi:hypothetical protein